MITMTLPWPPSMNAYWRRVGTRTLISKPGRQFRKAVLNDLALWPYRRDTMTGRLAVEMTCYPPDNRKRDLDNLPKSVLDALTHAGIWEDDGQIDYLLIQRASVESPGRVVVEVREL